MDPKAPVSPLEPTPNQVIEPTFPANTQSDGHTKRNILLICGVLVVILVAVFAVVVFAPVKNTSQTKVTVTPSTKPNIPNTQTVNKSNNPLIDNKDATAVENAYKTQYQKAGKTHTTSQYQFKYELAPALKSKGSSMFPVAASYAADTCNIASAPTDVTGYLLKNHFSIASAATLAKDYKMDTSVVASIPTEGGTFQYFYSDPTTSAYFKLSEPSGVYTYHMGKPNSGSSISIAQAQTIATKTLTDHKLDSKLTPTNSGLLGTDPFFQAYMFSYNKAFTFKMIDSESLKSLAASNSICNVGLAQNMNYVNVLIGTNGDLGKVVNQTRQILGEYTLKRQSLEDSLAEYEDDTVISPIVSGGTTSGTVSVDQAVLTYFDLGEVYAQDTYIPMYITSGTLPSGARVISVFPAVSKEEIKKTALAPATDSYDNLQLGTFNPAPPPPAGKLCWGNLVDYTITCSANSQPVCTGFTSLPSDKNDPWGVCGKGCITKTGVITVNAGDDPCEKFMEKQGLPPTYNGNAPGGTSFGGGDVSCSLGGCPC